jgi:AcrR family transcriptional regulator
LGSPYFWGYWALNPATRVTAGYIGQMARGAETRDHIVRTALALTDEQGIEALTLRALGRATGLHHTAIYRHFRDRNDVLQAVYAMLTQEALERVQPLPQDPRESLLIVFRVIRHGMREHPQLAAALLLPVADFADSTAVKDLQTIIISALRQMGLEGADLVIHHRLLESYVFGTSTFDFSGAPNHFKSRSDRLKLADNPAFELIANDVAIVDQVNEEAFERGLIVLLDACEMAGQVTRDSRDGGQLAPITLRN